MDNTLTMIEQAIATRPNFPKKGILFYDISSLTANPKAFQACVDLLCDYCKEKGAQAVAGADARGFIFAGAVAGKLSLPLYLLRKPGKLARAAYEESYALEYGQDRLCLAEGDVHEGENVVVLDDLVATGGTMAAACRLFEKHGAKVVGIGAVIGLPYAGYEKALEGHDVHALLSFEAPNL